MLSGPQSKSRSAIEGRQFIVVANHSGGYSVHVAEISCVIFNITGFGRKMKTKRIWSKNHGVKLEDS
jgi:hypothetical protein